MIIAVDFDGTLAVTEFPNIIDPIPETIRFCKECKERGDTLILYTCRTGIDLEEALIWCSKMGLEFDYVNENIPEKIARYGDCRKIYADIYLDDHNWLVSNLK